MEPTIKIALVGAGMFGGDVHLRAYTDLQRFGIAGITIVDPNRAGEGADRVFLRINTARFEPTLCPACGLCENNIMRTSQTASALRRIAPKCGPLAAILCVIFASSILPVHSADDADRVSTARIPSGLKAGKAQAGPDGAIHVVADLDAGPQYVVSRDGGKTFSTPIPIVDSAARKPGLKFIAWDIAVGKESRVHVALGTNAWQLKLPKDEWGYFYAALAPGAKAFTPVRNINHKPSEGFSIAAGDRGAVVATFLAGKIYTMTSRDGGATFSEPAEPDASWNPCKCCTTSVAYGGKPSHTRVSITPWKIAACPMTYFTVVPSASGYIAAWPTKGQIYFARLGKDGAVLPPGEIKTPGTNGMRTGVIALGASDGATLIAWKNNDTLGWQFYDAKGQPVGSAGSAPSAGSGAAGVALANGKFVLIP